MRNATLTGILSNPKVSVVVLTDSFAGRVAEIAIALDCALDETSNADAERQLNKLIWLLCTRSGGGACRKESVPAPECSRTHRCVCGQAAELVAAA